MVTTNSIKFTIRINHYRSTLCHLDPRRRHFEALTSFSSSFPHPHPSSPSKFHTSFKSSDTVQQVEVSFERGGNLLTLKYKIKFHVSHIPWHTANTLIPKGKDRGTARRAWTNTRSKPRREKLAVPLCCLGLMMKSSAFQREHERVILLWLCCL